MLATNWSGEEVGLGLVIAGGDDTKLLDAGKEVSCTHIWCRRARLLTCSGPRVEPGLLSQQLPADETDAVARHVREHDRLARIFERWNASST
jgi:hypothetical protein